MDNLYVSSLRFLVKYSHFFVFNFHYSSGYQVLRVLEVHLGTLGSESNRERG